MSITIIAAIDKSGGFGKDGKIPWRFPEDFKHFKDKTIGKICVMGRVTYQDMAEMANKSGRSIKKGILPDRIGYVLSSDKSFKPIGAKKVSSLQEVKQLHPDREIMVLGGQQLFEQSIDEADSIWLTVIDNDYQCDRFFPTDKLEQYTINEGSKHITSNGSTLYFIKYDRSTPT